MSDSDNTQKTGAIEERPGVKSSKRIEMFFYSFVGVALTVFAIWKNADWRIALGVFIISVFAALVFAGLCTAVDIKNIVAGGVPGGIPADDNSGGSPTGDGPGRPQ